jgi:signal transduction histidine kinase
LFTTTSKDAVSVILLGALPLGGIWRLCVDLSGVFLPPDAEKTASFLREAKQLGSRALQEVRRSISALRADPLQGQSLEVAIAKTVNEFHQTSGILPDYRIQLSQPIPPEISTALYRIIQESLTNIYKHSAATQVSIHLLESPNAIQLQINDNGQGFNPERNTTGFGLQGMRPCNLM